MKSILILISLVIGLTSSAMAGEKTQVFTKPKHKSGMRLDWCLYWGDECGKPAADYFCKTKGYEHARDYPISSGISEMTYVAGDDKECGPGCDSFAAIRCVKTVAAAPGAFNTADTLKTFMAPTVNGKRVDQCVKAKGPCGKMAASYFCKTQGYATAIDYGFVKLPNKATIHQLSKAVCTSGNCWGMKRVICKKGQETLLDTND
jgi:hypothetical protein